MVLIGVRTDDVTEESQTPEHDCLGDRRLSRAEADFLKKCVESTTDRTRRVVCWTSLSCPTFLSRTSILRHQISVDRTVGDILALDDSILHIFCMRFVCM